MQIEGRPPKQPNFLAQLLLQLAPALLLILVFVYMLRQMQGASGGRGAMSFGKSRARLLGEDQVNVTFADVAGVDEAKQEVWRDRRLPEGPGQVPEARRQDSQGRADGRLARYRQDAARPRHRRRSEGAVLHDLRLRLRRDVRRRRRLARARHVRAGEEARAVHHLHRRDRRGRPPSRRGPRRRSRRARADAEPAARRDGRLRRQRGHHRHRRHEPSGRARSGAAASGPLRPPGRGAAAGRARPRADPARPHAPRAAGRRREARR